MSSELAGRTSFLAATNVSRETMVKLDQYAALLKKWNKAINLVAPGTLPDLWTRHFLDSAQLLDLAPAGTKTWADMGSGAGFPGMVIACMAPDIRVTCIESDQRKATFLQTLVRELDLNVQVMVGRVEHTDPCKADIISARALAPVEKLLEYAEIHLKKGGTAIFLKGATHLREIDEARAKWSFDIRVHPSNTENEGAVLILGDIRRE